MIQLLAALGLIGIVVAVVMALRHTNDSKPTATKRGVRKQKVLVAGTVLSFALGTVLVAASVFGLFVSPSSASTLSHHAPVRRVHRPARPVGPGRIVDLALAPGGTGYWEVTSTGVVYAFGSASFYGDLVTAHVRPPLPVVAIVPTAAGTGYYIVDGAHSMVWPFGIASLYPAVPSIPVLPPSGGSSPIIPVVIVLVLMIAGGFACRWAWKKFRNPAQAPRIALASAEQSARRLATTVAPSATATRAKATAPAPPVVSHEDADWDWDQ